MCIRFKWMAAIAIIAATALWYFAGSNPVQPQTVQQQTVAGAEAGVTVGKSAPIFTLTALDGRQVTIGKPGRLTIINFWATWCPPCREEMPELDNFAQQHRQNLEFYAINIQEPSEKVTEFLKQHRYAMPVLLDSDGGITKTFRINAIPTTLVIDRNGVIRFRKSGGVTQSELEGIIKGL